MRVPKLVSATLARANARRRQAENQAGEEFGPRKISDIVRSNWGASAQEIVDLLYQEAITFSERDTFDDDLTIMVLKVEPALGQ